MHRLRQLEQEKNKSFILKLAMEAAEDSSLFQELAKLAFSADRLALRASWTLGFACDFRPDRLAAIEEELIRSLDQGHHTGITRNLLRIFTVIPVQEEQEALLVSEAFRLFFDRRFPIAVKVYALIICMQLSDKYPELLNDVRLMAESVQPEHGPALNITARRALKKLARQKRN